MELIRNNIFETNSSSTHSLVIMSKDEYNKWQNHEVTIDISKSLGTVNPLTDTDKEIKRLCEDGLVEYKGHIFDSVREFMDSEDYYDVIDDCNASTEYIKAYADTVKKETDTDVILSIYREDRW